MEFHGVKGVEEGMKYTNVYVIFETREAARAALEATAPIGRNGQPVRFLTSQCAYCCALPLPGHDRALLTELIHGYDPVAIVSAKALGGRCFGTHPTGNHTYDQASPSGRTDYVEGVEL